MGTMFAQKKLSFATNATIIMLIMSKYIKCHKIYVLYELFGF